MSYIEGIDYWVRRRAFPCTTIYAWAVSLGDGTFDIWLNSNVSEEKQLSGLQHELRHLEDNHFYREDLSLAEKEQLAWGEQPPLREDTLHGKLPDVFSEAPPGTIPLFNSLDAFRDYMFSMREQYQNDRSANER